MKAKHWQYTDVADSVDEDLRNSAERNIETKWKRAKDDFLQKLDESFTSEAVQRRVRACLNIENKLDTKLNNSKADSGDSKRHLPTHLESIVRARQQLLQNRSAAGTERSPLQLASAALSRSVSCGTSQDSMLEILSPSQFSQPFPPKLLPRLRRRCAACVRRGETGNLAVPHPGPYSIFLAAGKPLTERSPGAFYRKNAALPGVFPGLELWPLGDGLPTASDVSNGRVSRQQAHEVALKWPTIVKDVGTDGELSCVLRIINGSYDQIRIALEKGGSLDFPTLPLDGVAVEGYDEGLTSVDEAASGDFSTGVVNWRHTASVRVGVRPPAFRVGGITLEGLVKFPPGVLAELAGAEQPSAAALAKNCALPFYAFWSY